MNIELILWIVASVVVVETIFILLLKHNEENIHWFGCKMLALFITVLIIVVQVMIIFSVNEAKTSFDFSSGNYMNLLYEGLIFLAIFLFFYLNKKIADWIESNENKARERAKKELGIKPDEWGDY